MSRNIFRTLVWATCAGAVVGFAPAGFAPAGSGLVGAALADTAEGEERTRSRRPRPLSTLFGSGGSTGPAANEIDAKQTPSRVDGRTINITQPKVPDSLGGTASKKPQPRVQPEPQPTTPVLSQPQLLQPGQQQQAQPVQKVKTQPAKKKRRARKKPSRNEPAWWAEVGNPKVAALRDCLSGYATEQAQARPKVNLKAVVASGRKSGCKSQSGKVYRALKARFGRKQARRVSSELVGSTYVPAVRAAVLAVREQQKNNQSAAAISQASLVPAAKAPAATAQPAAAPQPVGPQLNLAIAKEEMFTCYRKRTDLLGANANQGVDVLVDQVLLDCSDYTRAFFTRLFEVYPHSPAKQAEKMRTAISQNYRPAIAGRFEALRKARAQSGATGNANGSGSSTFVKSATSASQ